LADPTQAHNKALVSVIVVTRNRTKLADRAIESIYAQSYRPIEIVIIDNQSNPAYEPPPSVAGITTRTFRTDRKLNASEARNSGIEQCSGAYIGFLDDDDFYYPDKISSQVSAFDSCPDADFCIIAHETRTPHGKWISASKNGDLTLETVMLYRPIHTNSPLIRAHILKKERFCNELNKYTDLFLTYSLFEKYKFVHADGVGSVWMCDNREDQITNYKISSKIFSMNRNRSNWKILCDHFSHIIDKDPRLRKKYYGRQVAFSLLSFRLRDVLHYGLAAFGLNSKYR